MQVALPMYTAPDGAVQAFWEALRGELQPRLPTHALPHTLEWPSDYLTHWRAPALLLSQSCGYPLTHALQGQVQLLGTFVYSVPGARGMHCRSQVIRRRDDVRTTLQAFGGSTAAINAADSQSGYNALRALVAPLAVQGRFFGHTLETGAHLQSIQAVLRGRADIAAIDAVTWALAQDADPTLAQRLTVLTETAPYPGLPLITALSTPADVVQQLQAALHTVATDATFAAVRAPLRIGGFVRSTLDDYAACVAMETAATALAMNRSIDI